MLQAVHIAIRLHKISPEAILGVFTMDLLAMYFSQIKLEHMGFCEGHV